MTPLSRSLLLAMLVLSPLATPDLHAQQFTANGSDQNALRTSATFLTISPDARAASMGDAGVASKPDEYSMYWNVAKFAFLDKRFGFTASHSPWFRSLIPDISLSHASAFLQVAPGHVLSTSLTYFDLGTFVFNDSLGELHMEGKPHEFAADLGYSIKLGEHLSGGIALRYIQSDLSNGYAQTSAAESKPGRSIAADLGIYYQNEIPLDGLRMEWAVGAHLSNLGSPISYSEGSEGLRIPSNLRLGGRFDLELGSNHRFGFLTDLNKLLVPTPPVYYPDSTNADGSLAIFRGNEPPSSVVAGMFTSFWDAPGYPMDNGNYSVFLEELHEITLSFGFEYELLQMMFFRTGYFLQHSTKGNRKYLSLGTGVRFWKMAVDLAYLWPENRDTNPLNNTFRISLSLAI